MKKTTRIEIKLGTRAIDLTKEQTNWLLKQLRKAKDKRFPQGCSGEEWGQFVREFRAQHGIIPS